MSGNNFSILQGRPPPEETIQYQTLHDECNSLTAKQALGRLLHPKSELAGPHYSFTISVGTGHSEYNLFYTQKHIIAKVYCFDETGGRLTRREQVQVLAADIQVADSLQTGQRGPPWTLDSDALRTASHLETNKVGYYILPITFHHEAAYYIRSIKLRFIWHRMQGRGPEAIYERESRGMRLIVWKEGEKTEMREVYQPWSELDKALTSMEKRLELPTYRQTGGPRNTTAASLELARRWKAVVTSPGFSKSTKLSKSIKKPEEQQQESSAAGPVDNTVSGEQSPSRIQAQESKQAARDVNTVRKDKQEQTQTASRITPLTLPSTPWMKAEPRKRGKQTTDPGPASGDLKSLRSKREQQPSSATLKGKTPIYGEDEQGQRAVAAVDNSNPQTESQRRDTKGKSPVRNVRGDQLVIFQAEEHLNTNLEEGIDAGNLTPAGTVTFAPWTKSGPVQASPRRHVRFEDEERHGSDKANKGKDKSTLPWGSRKK